MQLLAACPTQPLTRITTLPAFATRLIHLPCSNLPSLPSHPLQAPLPPVALARDLFVQYAFSPAHFLDHAAYDCGRLEPTTAA